MGWLGEEEPNAYSSPTGALVIAKVASPKPQVYNLFLTCDEDEFFELGSFSVDAKRSLQNMFEIWRLPEREDDDEIRVVPGFGVLYESENTPLRVPRITYRYVDENKELFPFRSADHAFNALEVIAMRHFTTICHNVEANAFTFMRRTLEPHIFLSSYHPVAPPLEQPAEPTQPQYESLEEYVLGAYVEPLMHMRRQQGFLHSERAQKQWNAHCGAFLTKARELRTIGQAQSIINIIHDKWLADPSLWKNAIDSYIYEIASVSKEDYETAGSWKKWRREYLRKEFGISDVSARITSEHPLRGARTEPGGA